MGKVLLHDLFEIYIFSRDHLPAHMHIYFPKKRNPKGFVILEIHTLEVMELEGISQKDLKRLITFLSKTRVEILKEEWERLHGQ